MLFQKPLPLIQLVTLILIFLVITSASSSEKTKSTLLKQNIHKIFENPDSEVKTTHFNFEKDAKYDYLLKDVITLPNPNHPFVFPSDKPLSEPAEIASLATYVMMGVVIYLLCITVGIIYLYVSGLQSNIGDKAPEVRRDCIDAIDQMFVADGGVVVIGKQKKIAQHLTEQIDENERISPTA
jgi:hypothetical protein